MDLDRPSRSFDSDAIAQASSTCDGCSAVAATGQVVVFKRVRQAQAVNVATSCNQCTNCSSTALSIQFVVIGGAKDEVTPRASDLVSQVRQLMTTVLLEGSSRARGLGPLGRTQLGAVGAQGPPRLARRLPEAAARRRTGRPHGGDPLRRPVRGLTEGLT